MMPRYGTGVQWNLGIKYGGPQSSHLPTPETQTKTATKVATSDEPIPTAGINVPTMAMHVKVAKIPPAGVKPPYIQDWKAAAAVPEPDSISHKFQDVNLGRAPRNQSHFPTWNDAHRPKAEKHDDRADDGEGH